MHFSNPQLFQTILNPINYNENHQNSIVLKRSCKIFIKLTLIPFVVWEQNALESPFVLLNSALLGVSIIFLVLLSCIEGNVRGAAVRHNATDIFVSGTRRRPIRHRRGRINPSSNASNPKHSSRWCPKSWNHNYNTVYLLGSLTKVVPVVQKI